MVADATPIPELPHVEKLLGTLAGVHDQTDETGK
jgi:hypothetical protein